MRFYCRIHSVCLFSCLHPSPFPIHAYLHRFYSYLWKTNKGLLVRSMLWNYILPLLLEVIDQHRMVFSVSNAHCWSICLSLSFSFFSFLLSSLSFSSVVSAVVLLKTAIIDHNEEDANRNHSSYAGPLCCISNIAHVEHVVLCLICAVYDV